MSRAPLVCHDGRWAFTRRAIDSGLLPSMGSVGDCYDKPVIESFWSRMQVELLDRKRWRTRVELANAIFEYLEIFHLVGECCASNSMGVSMPSAECRRWRFLIRIRQSS